MLRRAVPVLAALALVAAVIVAGRVGIRAESVESSTVPTTVWLYEGWNLVGWIGEAGQVDDLFDQASEIEAVYAQASSRSETGQLVWQELERDSTRSIRSGEALWIRVSDLSGKQAIAWKQEAVRELPDVHLPAGQSAVVWSWDGSRRLGAALGRLTDQLSHAYIWEKRDQRFHRYSAAFSSLDWWDSDVFIGSAILVELTAPATWGPPSKPVITDSDWMTDLDRQTIQEAAEAVHDYFDTWLGITPRAFDIHPQQSMLSCLSDGGPYALRLHLPCHDLERLVQQAVSDRYVAAARQHARSLTSHDEPEWLIFGHAEYVRLRWVSKVGIRPYRQAKVELVGYARATDLAIDGEMLNAGPSYPRPPWNTSREALQRALGALAIDWLVQQNGVSALRQYSAERFSGNWRAAFERAFSLTVEQAIVEFEAYRARLVSADNGAPRLSRPLHHLVYFGPITDKRREVVEVVEQIAQFFEEEYGLVAYAAMFVLDLDDTAYSEIRRTIGGSDCGSSNGSTLFVADHCMIPFIIAHEYAHLLTNHLSHGNFDRQPLWFYEGVAEYLALQQSADDGRANLDSAQRSREEFARSVVEALPTDQSDVELAVATIERDSYYKIYFLAVQHFVELLGIESLFEAFNMPVGDRSQDFEDRFPAAFGMTLEEFFASFGAWLRTLL